MLTVVFPRDTPHHWATVAIPSGMLRCQVDAATRKGNRATAAIPKSTRRYRITAAILRGILRFQASAAILRGIPCFQAAAAILWSPLYSQAALWETLLHPRGTMRAQHLSPCLLPLGCICQEVAELPWLDPRATLATSCSNLLALECQPCADGASKAPRPLP